MIVARIEGLKVQYSKCENTGVIDRYIYLKESSHTLSLLGVSNKSDEIVKKKKGGWKKKDLGVGSISCVSER